MGREVRRVPADFGWPLDKVWGGYVNPHWGQCRECPFCEVTGLNEASKAIADDFYDSAGHGMRWRYTRDERGRPDGIEGDTRRWCDRITQDEVDALVARGRLRVRRDGEWVSEPRTAEEVNAENTPSAGGFGHDALNRGILVEARATRLGVWGLCEVCKGEGLLWRTPEAEAAYDAWEPTEPPTGDAYQLWETVSEGSPVSPVFVNPEGLAQWLASNGYASKVGDALGWVTGSGWATTAIMTGGRLQTGIEHAAGG